MKKQLLLPRRCKLIGCILAPLSIAWLIAGYFGEKMIFPHLKYIAPKADKDNNLFNGEFLFSNNMMTDFNGTLSILFTLASLFMIAFAREKYEDEYVMSVRLRSLQIAMYVNYAILAVASCLFYSFSYITVMQANLFTMLIVFILVFHYSLYVRPRFSKTTAA